MPVFPGTETILVVDDEIAVLRLATLMLERHGYRVLTAASGKEALHLLELWVDLKLHLAIVDLLMPDMHGVDVAQAIKVLRPETKILFCSGFPDQKDLLPAFARSTPYIAKPFTSIQLTTKIRDVLDGERSEGAAG